MNGKTQADAYAIAAAVARGATAELVGHKVLEGLSMSYINVDGRVIPVTPRRREAPGIRLEDHGKVVWYVCASRENAQMLFDRVTRILSDGA